MKCCYYIDMLLLQDGVTPLHIACSDGHTETVNLLLNNNADISATDNVSDKILLSVKHLERHSNLKLYHSIYHHTN